MWKNPEFRKKRAESMTKYFETKEAKDTCKRRSINIWANTETRKKYGEKISNKWKEPEFRERRLNQKKSKENVENFKKNCHTKEANAKTALANTKNHGKIQSPEGEIFEVIGLKTFCLEHDIPLSSLGNLSKVLKGQVKSIFGWKLVSL